MMVDDQVSSGTHQHLVLPYFNDNRIKYNYLLQGGKFDPWDQIKISSCMWLFPKKRGLWLRSKKLYVKIMHVHMWSVTHVGRYLGMTPKLSCSCNKSSYLSEITLYVEHAISDIQPSLGFHCISSYLDDDPPQPWVGLKKC